MKDLSDISQVKKVVIKVGTSTLTHETGRANIRRIEHLVKVLCDLANAGRQLVLVSSGALSVGCGKLGLRERPRDTPTRQAASAVGQCELMHLYDTEFSRYNHTVGQVLMTKDIVDIPARRQNVVNTFDRLTGLGAIPIVNENDTVAVDELEGDHFGDNDTLSAVVAELVGADALVILSDIDGLYDDNPRVNPSANLIPVVVKIDETIAAMASGAGSKRGTGGMVTKVHAAEIAGEKGIPTYIVNGQNPDTLYDLFDGRQVGTHFVACPAKPPKP